MQLATFHRGWENEHLATFLLSRIAFVASPIKIGDDIGTDLFCTLFATGKHNGKTVLLPQRSVAVQVKSDRSPVDIVPHLSYLAGLEVPYYLGVVDRAGLTLQLFSARLLPALLSLRGHHSKLFLQPTDTFDRQYRPIDDQGHHSLLCHRVATLSASDGEETLAVAAAAIREDSAAALQAIASRLNHEYVFEIPGGEVEVYAGPDSARTFRHSFYKRLAEAYFNFSWLIDHGSPAPDAEMNAFEAIADHLSDVPEWVEKFRQGLRGRRAERRPPGE